MADMALKRRVKRCCEHSVRDRREKLTGSTFRFVLGAVERSLRAAVELEH